MNKMPFRLGLTGSIATGKSTALRYFAELGHSTFSSDEIVHQLYEGEAVAPVGAAFPEVSDGTRIDRAALAALLINQPNRMIDLEAIVHPLVRSKIDLFLTRAVRQSADLVIVDIPLLLESAHPYPLDAVAVTYCTADEQRRRALARPGMTAEKFATLLGKQLPQAEKKRRADFLIDTNGTFDETRAQGAESAATCLRRRAGLAKPDEP
mgnify:CR=1 FL=1